MAEGKNKLRYLVLELYKKNPLLWNCKLKECL